MGKNGRASPLWLPHTGALPRTHLRTHTYRPAPRRDRPPACPTAHRRPQRGGRGGAAPLLLLECEGRKRRQRGTRRSQALVSARRGKRHDKEASGRCGPRGGAEAARREAARQAPAHRPGVFAFMTPRATAGRDAAGAREETRGRRQPGSAAGLRASPRGRAPDAGAVLGRAFLGRPAAPGRPGAGAAGGGACRQQASRSTRRRPARPLKLCGGGLPLKMAACPRLFCLKTVSADVARAPKTAGGKTVRAKYINAGVQRAPRCKIGCARRGRWCIIVGGAQRGRAARSLASLARARSARSAWRARRAAQGERPAAPVALSPHSRQAG